MNIKKFVEYSKISVFFNPLTPQGKIYKENLEAGSDIQTIKRRHDSVSMVLDFSKKKPLKADKLRYHLRNIPKLDFSVKELSLPEIFNFKKFLNHCSCVFFILGQKEKTFFSAFFNSQPLLDFLSKDFKEDEFYISDSYHKNLSALRKNIEKENENIQEIKADFFKQIYAKTGLDFARKDFLLVDCPDILKQTDLLYIEPYDSKRFLVKPKINTDILKLLSRKEELLAKEKQIESEVLSEISARIISEKKNIELCLETLTDIDIAFASAKMAEDLNLSKPKLEFKTIECENAFFIPLKLELDEMRIKYSTLSFCFDKRLNIITGSNMGGKTVVLKTVAQLQFMAQCGFFVPAKKYKSCVFEKIFANGDEENLAGLSSYAAEIKELADILAEKSKTTLLFSDEFAKTTNVKEAQALFSALMEKLAGEKKFYFFGATHFYDIKPNEECEFLSMKGFDRQKFEKHGLEEKDASLFQRIKTINRNMDYTVVRNKKQKDFYDALIIASILGLDEDILKKAENMLAADKTLKDTFEPNK